MQFFKLNLTAFVDYMCDLNKKDLEPSPIAQSVASPTADPDVTLLILAWPHTFVEIDHHCHHPSSADLKRVVVLSVTSENMCTKYWLTD